VHFAEPEGASVRIGNGFAHTIPWSTHLGIGAHSVVLSPNGRSGFLGMSPGEDALSGWIVVLEAWEGGVAEFRVSPWDMKDAASGSEIRTSGTTPEGIPAFEFKASREGVPGDDGEVAGWTAHAESSRDVLPPDGFVGGLVAVGKFILQAIALVFLFWLELESDDDEEECY